MSKRKPIEPAVETQVLLKSRRRCCLCVHLHHDFEIKNGQLAHVDHDPSNSSEDNLVFLCLDHHTEYDSKTSQHKNFTKHEVVAARNSLYAQTMQGQGLASSGKNAPSINQSGGMNFGTAGTVQVYGDVIGGDNAPPRKHEALRERGEELYRHLDRWLNAIAGYCIRLNSVMQGKLTYNQFLDLEIEDGKQERDFDFSRIELLIDLDFSSLRAAYESLIGARTAMNRIASEHKRAYEDGLDGARFLGPFIAAQKTLEARGDDLKRALVNSIRGASS